MVDFFNEVEEDLRADQMRSLGKTYLPWAIGAVVLAFAGAGAWWGYTSMCDADTRAASLAYDKGLKALSSGDKGEADRDFGQAAKPLAQAYRSLALMQQAGVALAQNRDAQAVTSLDAAGRAAGGDRILSDQAAIKAAWLAMDTAPLSEMQSRLRPLTEKGRPYRAEAYEALAMAEFKAERFKEAKADFGAIKLMLDAPKSVADRAEMAIETIDAGGAAGVIATAKAAAALPPQSAAAPNPFAPTAGPPAPQAGAAPQ